MPGTVSNPTSQQFLFGVQTERTHLSDFAVNNVDAVITSVASNLILQSGTGKGGITITNDASGNNHVGIATSTPSALFAMDVSGSVHIRGHLEIDGETTTVNTQVINKVTDQLEVTNDGSGPAIKARQMGPEPVFDCFDDNQLVFRVADGGKTLIASGTVAEDMVTLATVPEAELDVHGSAIIRRNLRVKQASTLEGALTVQGVATMGSSLAVTGAATLASLGVTGAATVGSTLGVTGAANLSNALNVTGVATLSNALNVTGAATLSSTLGVTGAATLSSALTVAGTSTLNGLTQMNNDLGVGTNSNVANNATYPQNFGVESSDGTFYAVGGKFHVDAAGNVYADGEWRGSGDASISGDLRVGEDFIVYAANGNLDTSGNINTSTTLTVGGDTTLGGDLQLDGAVNIGSTADIYGNLIVGNAASRAATNSLGFAGRLKVDAATGAISSVTTNGHDFVLNNGNSIAIKSAANTSGPANISLSADGSFSAATNKFMVYEDGTLIIGPGNLSVSGGTGNTMIAGTLRVQDVATFTSDVKIGDNASHDNIQLLKSGQIISTAGGFNVNAFNMEYGNVDLAQGITRGALFYGALNAAAYIPDGGDQYSPAFKFRVQPGTGNVTAEGTLNVSGDSNFGNKFAITASTGAFSAADQAFIVYPNGALAIATNKFTVSAGGDVAVAGNTSIDGQTLSKGNLIVDMDGDMNGPGSKFFVSAADGSLSCSGQATFKSDVYAEGDLYVSALGFPYKFSVDSATGDVSTEGILTVAGNASVGSNFSITASDGSLSAAAAAFTVASTGALAIATNKFTVSPAGNVAAAGTLNVTGPSTLSSLSVSQYASVAGALTVSGDGTFNSKLVTQGDAIFEARANVKGDFIVGTGGDIGVIGPSRFKVTAATGAFYAADQAFTVAANGALAIATNKFTVSSGGNTAIAGTLDVTGASTLNSAQIQTTLGVNGATSLGSTLGVTGAANLSSTLYVTGSTTLDSIFFANGAASFGSTVRAKGDLTVGASGASNFVVDAASGNITSIGNLSLDKAYVGNNDTSANAIFGYKGLNKGTGFAIQQDPTGNTTINSVASSGNATVDVAYNNVVKQQFKENGDLVIQGNLFSYSDRSLKTDIVPLANPLAKVLALKGVNYTFIADEKHTVQMGLIAQEVEEVVPEVVTESEGIKKVAYANLVSLLIEAVKELKAEVDTLKGQLCKCQPV